MEKLELLISDGFEVKQAEELKIKLDAILPINGPLYYFTKSAETSAFQFIQLIGDKAAWLGLSAAAVVAVSFLNTLGKKAAEITWEELSSHLKKKKAASLSNFADTLAQASKGKMTIFIGLDIPDNYFGTTLAIDKKGQKEIAIALAYFIANVEKLSNEMNAEVKAGRAPLGRAEIKVDDEGNMIVEWTSSKDFSKCRKKIE